MEKKTILYIVGGVAVVGGIAYLLWKRSNKNKEEKTDETAKVESSDETAKKEEVKKEETSIVSAKTSSTPSTSTPSSTPTTTKPTVKKLTPKELEFKLQQLCGKSPLLKRNKKLYDQCRTKYTNKLRADGFIDFLGDSESVVSNGFYSSFDDSMNLDI